MAVSVISMLKRQPTIRTFAVRILERISDLHIFPSIVCSMLAPEGPGFRDVAHSVRLFRFLGTHASCVLVCR
jgi:hypothetical protein